MAYNKNKRVVTILIVLLFLFVLIFPYVSRRNYTSWSTDLFSPFLKNIKNFAEEAHNTLTSIINVRQITGENQELKIEVQQLKQEIDNLKEIAIENKSLKKLLEFKEELAYETIPAKIIGRDATSWYRSMIVDKGKKQGVHIDMPVVSYGGVVGKIVEVTNNNSTVILITDKKSKIGGIVQETRDAGIIEGTAKNFCQMKYILKDAELKQGDVVITSGFGGIYPQGLRIGVITRIYQEKYGLYKYVDIAPSVDLNRLEEVLIIFN